MLDVQFTTAVIGAVATGALDSGRGMRNFLPSAETAKVLQLPVCPGTAELLYRLSNSSMGVEDSNVFAPVVTATAINFESEFDSMKKSSRPSPRHRGKTPPFVDI